MPSCAMRSFSDGTFDGKRERERERERKREKERERESERQTCFGPPRAGGDQDKE